MRPGRCPRWTVRMVGCLAVALTLGLGSRAYARQGEPGTEGGEEHAGAHGGAPSHELGSINWLDFGNKTQPPWGAYAINFALIAGIYYYFGRKGVANALKARREAVVKEIEQADRLRREAEERAKRYQRKLGHLEADLEAARKALVDAGVRERERLIKEGEEKAARMGRDAQFLIGQEVRQMRQDLLREAAELAVRAAEDLLRQRLTPADQEQLAQAYLDQLAAWSAPARGAQGAKGLTS